MVPKLLGAPAATIIIAIAGCGGGSGSSASGGDGGNDGNGPTPIYGQCAGVAAKAIAGSHTDSSGFTFSWPAGWTGAMSGSSFEVNAPYQYLPTGSTTPANASVYIGSSTMTATDANDAQKLLDAMATEYTTGTAEHFTVSGHPAVVFWYRLPPAQPGCQGCPSDPGPDYITIGVGAANGTSVFQLTGSARLDAPDSIFCDIQQTEESLAIGQ
jgi:hypothetical protein